MNRWKIAFWICLIVWILTLGFSLFSMLNSSFTITYMREGFDNTERDLGTILRIVNETDLKQEQVREILKDHDKSGLRDFEGDTIYMERTMIIFRKGRLASIEDQW